jgi:HNH endonuclease
MPRQPSWTDAELIAAVAGASCFKQVCDALGLWAGGGTYRTLERHMARLGIDSSHLARRQGPRTAARRRRWTDDELTAAVRASESWAEVARRLGYAINGGIHRFLRGHVVRLGLDTSHFTGQAWARGASFPGRRARPLSEILVERSTAASAGLRRRLIAEGLKPAHCELCGITEWRGQPLQLELDHVNGDHTDHRLENLRVLCPNCHSATETFCRRKRASNVPVEGFEPSLTGF